jgi:hypothetical protein
MAPLRRPRPLPPEVVVARLGRLGAGFEVGSDPPSVAWTDGRGLERVAAAIGEVSGWGLRAGVPVPGTELVVFLDRTLTDAALAACVVRFQGSRGRPWSPELGPAHQAAWQALIDGDASAYPIVDTMARLLLEEPDPLGLEAAGGRAGFLSAKLAAAGYDRLWAVAFAAAP